MQRRRPLNDFGIISVGFTLFAASIFMNIYVTSDYGCDQLFWPNVVRAA